MTATRAGSIGPGVRVVAPSVVSSGGLAPSALLHRFVWQKVKQNVSVKSAMQTFLLVPFGRQSRMNSAILPVAEWEKARQIKGAYL